MKLLRYIILSAFLFSGFVLSAQEKLTFDVHFAVLTKNVKAQEVANLDQLKREIEILNKYFVREDGSKFIEFKFKSATFYSELSNSECQLVKFEDKPLALSDQTWRELFNQCNDAKVRDPFAINIYIVDSFTDKNGYSDFTSKGFKNGSNPFILLDWERLDHRILSAEEHEMGHVFGLGHLCIEGATRDTHTNIMTSSCKLGKEGQRDIGFNEKQVEIIIENAKKLNKSFARAKIASQVEHKIVKN